MARNSFWEAGQDSYTQAPAQNPDLFESLLNVEPVTQGTLQRRRGYTLFTSALAPTQAYQRSYAFRSDSLGLRRYVWSGLTSVDATDELGNTILAPIFTPSNGALFPPRMVLSRDYGYFTDGLVVDSKKWDGTVNVNNLTNWGIAVNSTAAGAMPPRYAGTGTNVVNDPTATPWTNPANIVGPPDGSFATVNLTASSCTSSSNACFAQTLQGTNYGFTIPPSAGGITGIQVAITSTVTCTTCRPPYPLVQVGVMKGGVVVGGKATILNFGGASVTTLGGLGDLWGSSFTSADINASNFGVAFVNANGNGANTSTFSIDSVQVSIFTSGGSSAFTIGAGNINLLSGRTYFTAFRNDTTGHVSTLSPASLSTGPLTNAQVNLNSIPVSNDPQVTTTLILATADGNDQTTLYLIGTVTNGTTTFVDNVPDTFTTSYTSGPTVLTSPLYQNTDINGILHGIANNNPPPSGLNFPTKHKGRIYGAVGRALYFSKNLDEVTTANGLVTSKWEEAWPATNQFDISETAETIQGLLSDGETLWIGTERGIRRLVGDSPANFQKPEIQFNETGLLTQDTWKVVFYEGQPVGTMWITPDFRIMASDFNTYEDVGRPIQDLLNSITSADGTSLYNAHASFVSQASFDLYMLYIPVNGSTLPNRACVYNLRTKKWVIWQPTDVVGTSLFNINATGTPQWLFATGPAPGSALYFWDATQTQDRVNNTPIGFSVTMRTSWLNMGDEGLMKALNQQILYTNDPALSLLIQGGMTQADILPTGAAPVVLTTTQVVTGPLGGYFYLPLAGTASSYYWYKFTWSSSFNSTAKVLLGGFNTEVIPIVRV